MSEREREREKQVKANNHTQIIQAITLQLKLPKLQLPKGADFPSVNKTRRKVNSQFGNVSTSKVEVS